MEILAIIGGAIIVLGVVIGIFYYKMVKKSEQFLKKLENK